MKVAIVHSYYSSRQPSGENVVVDAQAAALRSVGVDVEIVGARTDDLETEFGYAARSAFRVATGRGTSPLSQLRTFQPDVVHVHNLFPNWGTRWVEEWTGPVVATVHNFRPVCAAGTLFRDGHVCTACPDSGSINAIKHACYRGSGLATLPLAIQSRGGVRGHLLLRRANKVVVLTARARRLYESFGLPSEKIAVIPNFVQDAGFSDGHVPGSGWVYIGRLSAEKGVVNLVKNWPDDETLHVYGDGPMREVLDLLSETRSNIVLHGSIDHADVPGVLAEAKGLVFPSEWPEGGVPQAYVEALAAGRMVVALAGSSAADDLVEAGAGIVFTDWSEFGNALLRASESQDDFSVEAREHYVAHYKPEAYLTKMLALYESTIIEVGRAHSA